MVPEQDPDQIPSRTARARARRSSSFHRRASQNVMRGHLTPFPSGQLDECLAWSRCVCVCVCVCASGAGQRGRFPHSMQDARRSAAWQRGMRKQGPKDFLQVCSACDCGQSRVCAFALKQTTTRSTPFAAHALGQRLDSLSRSLPPHVSRFLLPAACCACGSRAPPPDEGHAVCCDRTLKDRQCCQRRIEYRGEERDTDTALPAHHSPYK